MAGCCNARGCDQFFGERFARRAAKRYRERGVDKTARRMIEFVERRGVAGATVLEIGGGLGEIQIELLKLGAAHATNLELSPAYDAEARELLEEAGVAELADRQLADIALDGSGITAADVVVLNRVVCCYPDYERLLTAAAAHAERLLVFSHPPRNLVSRLAVTAQNLFFRVRRREFRVFTHPPDAMVTVLARNGLRPTFHAHGLVWHVVGLER
jgi:2-polyprenyl-3-methyl-5-hydroxy-6-metoxy-1,4-benzoquinol methylase